MQNSKYTPQGFLRISFKPQYTDMAVHAALRLFAAAFNWRPSLRRQLQSGDGWINFALGLRTETGAVAQTLRFHYGKVSVTGGIDRVDTLLIFQDESVVRDMARLTPNEVLLLLLNSKLRIEGNMSLMSLFNYYLSLLLSKQHKKWLQQKQRQDQAEVVALAQTLTIQPAPQGSANTSARLKACRCDQVQYLDDPYLGQYGLEDFPRVAAFLQDHFSLQPQICSERPYLLTQWFKRHGFETRPDGRPWHPVLRQGEAFRYLMSQKQPMIRRNDLLAGTTTRKAIGVLIYPDAHGTLIWGELLSLQDRALNPYAIEEQDRQRLHNDVFPFWLKRNFREWVRETYQAPLCQQLEERFAVYFNWKTVALSHTIADFPKLLRLGIQGLLDEVRQALAKADPAASDQCATLNGMIACLEGVQIYSRHLAGEAREQSLAETDPVRKQELQQIATHCAQVAEHPPVTLAEALQLIWIGWVALHMENTNAGLSFGRLDQWLQPFFAADMARLASDEARAVGVKQALELLACFFLRCTDHLPTVPDIGNYLFGGSSSDQAITLGGVTPDGESAVNDMTFLLLKVTEMLKLRDPNVNARYSTTKNSDTYLQRLCEVNLITTATPSIHGDENVMAALQGKGYAEDAIRDWSAVGCVEPCLSGQHMGHTGCLMFNLVAALEMALHQGRHPLMNCQVGPQVPAVTEAHYRTFDAFFQVFAQQLAFLAGQAVEYNNRLGEAHSVLRPSPWLSVLMDGCIQSARDATLGGARYNTSGVACIGLADVVDSLMSIKTLVFDEQRLSFAELKTAIDHNFDGYARIHALILNKAPKFGSGNQDALDMANRVTGLVHELFASRRNFRNGAYTTGFWSMSNHVAFGNLSGALPSGRKAGKAFTPGLTPSPHASNNLLDNLRDVARLEPTHMDNNLAFNVKYLPAAEDSHQQSVANMAAYVKTYCQLGGMQLQLNVVSSAVLKDAMLHPENYRDLLVRISGYNAYFVTLNRAMQIELIERAQYCS